MSSPASRMKVFTVDMRALSRSTTGWKVRS